MSQQITSTASNLINNVSKVIAPVTTPVSSAVSSAASTASSTVSSATKPIVSTVVSVATPVINTASSTVSSTVSSVENTFKNHKDYKKNLEIIAKYCIIAGLILLLTSYLTHVVSYLYKEKILPYPIGFFRKLFLILAIISLCVGIFCAVCWNYYY